MRAARKKTAAVDETKRGLGVAVARRNSYTTFVGRRRLVRAAEVRTPCITSLHQLLEERAVPLDVAAGPPRRLADGVQELPYYWSLLRCRAGH